MRPPNRRGTLYEAQREHAAALVRTLRNTRARTNAHADFALRARALNLHFYVVWSILTSQLNEFCNVNRNTVFALCLVM